MSGMEQTPQAFNADNIEAFLVHTCGHIEPPKSNRKVRYLQVACSFDIETTSFMVGEEKRATMYEWTFGLNGGVIYGRTWEEWKILYTKVVEFFGLNTNIRLLCYVHNLSYEMQWFKFRHEWEKVFSIEMLKPIYAVTTDGFEFRCSYLLSGYSLANLGKNLTKYKCSKMSGDLDYEKMRHSRTPLTNKEIGYCVNDVRVVMCYIQEQIEQNHGIENIPLTKTGFVREYCRQKCLYTDGLSHKQSKQTDKYKNYRLLMQSLTLEVEEYNELVRAFQGGFTHCNPFYVGKVVPNVTSFDFTSSYPSALLSEYYPCSKGEYYKPTSREDFFKQLRMYCCVFDVHFVNIHSKILFDHYLSLSHCRSVKNPVVSNGRIVGADELYTTITEVDLSIIQRSYTFDKMEIANLIRYEKHYLPTDLVKSILDLYVKKTTLKDVPEEVVNYMRSKGDLNSVFGMMVTSIIRDDIQFIDGHWQTLPPEPKKEIGRYNGSLSRFLFYPWGVWCTAYARRNLWTGILEFGNDYIYSDTDSVKVINADKHTEYIDGYNKHIQAKLEKAMDFHGIDFSLCTPKTIKDEPKPLGVWDFDGHYNNFKSLGSKRYMCDDNKGLHLTVSGLNKHECVPYMIQSEPYKAQPLDRIYNSFNDGFYVPAEYTGKKTHTYVDERIAGELTDYTGITAEYEELSFIHLGGAEYSLSIASEFAKFIRGIQEQVNID